MFALSITQQLKQSAPHEFLLRLDLYFLCRNCDYILTIEYILHLLKIVTTLSARRILSCLAVAVLLVTSADAEPRPYQLERYEALWAAPLFVSAQIAETLPMEPSAPEAAYRFLGMGTANGVELAYIQAPGEGQTSGRIEEISRNSRSGTTLLNVERTPDGGVAAVIFRKEDSIHRAALAEFPTETSPNPPESPVVLRAENVQDDFRNLGEVLQAASSAQPTLRTRLRQAPAAQ